MGQSQASQRLDTIKENVEKINEKLSSSEISEADGIRSHDVLLDYLKEIKFILSKSIRPARLKKVEKIIIAALEELAAVEGSLKNVEPRLRAKSLQNLHEIEKDIKMIRDTLANPNYETEKKSVDKYRKRLSLIEDFDQEIGVKRSELLDVVTSVENTFSELEIEEQLKQAEQRHYDSKLDLNRFVGVSDSDCYKKYKTALLQLKEQVDQVSEISEKVSDRKKYLLFNIQNNISALDKKVRENEDRISKQIAGMPVFKLSTPVTSNQNLIYNIVDSYDKFEKSFSANCPLIELEEIYKELSDLKMKIEQKVKVLENQIQIQDVDPLAELVPVKESDAIPVPSPREINKIKEIRNDVEHIRKEIGTNGHNHPQLRKKLQDYRTELNASYESEESRLLSEDTSRYVEEVLTLLDNLSRGSGTGDILVDIMSISTKVDQLGNRLKETNNTAKDYDSIQSDLLEHLYYLKKLNISAARSNVCQFRDYVLIQIDSHLSNLEKIKKNAGVLISSL